MVYLAVFAFGSLNAIDNPTRQSFVIEMVGPDRVVNAVSLNSVLVQAARIVGPAVAGLLIATVGVVACFGLNAFTFVAMIFALWRMDPSRLQAAPVAEREPGAIRAGLRYVRRTPELLVPLALMGLVGTLGFNFQVVLPLLAKFSFEAGPMTYAALVSAMAVGSIVGALVNGHRGRTGPRLIAGGALAFGVAALLSALMPSLAFEVPALMLLGAASVTFAATINSTLQLAVAPEMRGRVMALYSVVFLGSTPIGGPIAGAVSEHLGARAGVAMGAIATAAAASWTFRALRRLDDRPVDATGPTPASTAAPAVARS
jgi:MFS family permease